jgi:hypothetical protein
MVRSLSYLCDSCEAEMFRFIGIIVGFSDSYTSSAKRGASTDYET